MLELEPLRGHKCGTMADPDPKPTREERLAARLRENLRRRKAQARQQSDSDAALPKPDPGG
jgi:hypothetical protein